MPAERAARSSSRSSDRSGAIVKLRGRCESRDVVSLEDTDDQIEGPGIGAQWRTPLLVRSAGLRRPAPVDASPASHRSPSQTRSQLHHLFDTPASDRRRRREDTEALSRCESFNRYGPRRPLGRLVVARANLTGRFREQFADGPLLDCRAVGGWREDDEIRPAQLQGDLKSGSTR